MREFPCFDGPNDGGLIWTSKPPKAGDIFQDGRGHRYVFTSYFERWVYVGVSHSSDGVRFRAPARVSQ